MELIDTHCHLSMKEFQDDLADVISRASAAGVAGIVTVGTSPEDWKETSSIAGRYGLKASFALSPHDAKLWNAENAKLLESMLNTPEAAAVGETGLDFHYHLSTREEQIRSFEEHIELAESKELPLIIHSRDSFEETAGMLKNVRTAVIIHCFTYGTKEADAFLAEGFYISFSGIATFPKATDIQDTARTVPLDRMLIETDAPYLAPVPFRGKRCEPAFVSKTAEFIAGLRSMDRDEFAVNAALNARKIFKINK